MSEPLTLQDFAERTDAPRDEVERYRANGLLDPDADGLFDALDVLRLNFLRQYEEEGGTLADVREYIRSASAAGQSLLAYLFSPQTQSYTLEEAVRITGLTEEQLMALAAALGLSRDGVVTSNDIELIEIGKRMIDAGFSWDGLLEGASVYADSLRRIAEANLQMTHRYLCDPLKRAGRTEREISMAVQNAIAAIAPNAEMMLQRLYIRYMADASVDHAIAHLEPQPPDAPPGSMVSTIVFVDLSLFSSYTYIEGDEAAVDVIVRFDRAVRELCLVYNGRVIKQIGDEFMLIFRDPAEAVRFAVDLRDRVRFTDESVQARTGIHHGPVLYRIGDYWGNAVNVAARIVSMAMPNSILVTEPVAKAAMSAGIEAEEIGVRSLRGMEEPLSVYRVKGPASV